MAEGSGQVMASEKLMGITGKGTLHVFGTKSFELMEDESPILSGFGQHHASWWWWPGGMLYLTSQRLLFASWTPQLPRTSRAWVLETIEAIGTRRPWLRLVSSLGLAKMWYVQVAGRRYYFQTFFKANEWLEALSKATGLPMGEGGGP